MKPHHYYILLALGDQHRHGLAIAREAERLSSGSVRLWPATLYGALERLLDEGAIVELTEPGERPPAESERKRFYALSPSGREQLRRETERLASVVEVARASLGPRRRSAT